jgi:hypothetical protein
LKAWHCGLERLSLAGVFVFPSVRLQSSSRRRPCIGIGSQRSLPASREQQAAGVCIGLGGPMGEDTLVGGSYLEDSPHDFTFEYSAKNNTERLESPAQ